MRCGDGPAFCHPVFSDRAADAPPVPVVLHLEGTLWTFYGSVNPNGSPTDVVLEVGSGTKEAPAFDRSLPVKEGLILPEAFEFETDDLVAPFCVRFTATNEVGTTSTPALCPTRGLEPPVPPEPTFEPSPPAG